MEGLVCTIDIGEAMVELGCSAAESSYSTAVDLRACTLGDGEPVPA